jgi:glycosyltransferase involved in cell wall biosynthesis
VHLRGVPQTELYRYYSDSSVYVLPSIEDGFGMVVSEAMACGVPVICSANAGASDILDDGVNGYVVPAGDVPALKARLSALHGDEDRRRTMGLSAQRRAAECTWDRYGEDVLQAYRRALTTGGRL